MTKNKILNFGTSFLIAVTLTVAALFSSFFKDDVKLATRSVEVGQVNYEQSVQNLLNMFSDTKNEMDGFNASFSGSLKFGVKDSGLDFLVPNVDEITTNYLSNYDLTENLLYVTTSYYAGDVLVEQTTQSYAPIYDANIDDVYFEVDGAKITIKELLGDAQEECLAWFLPVLVPLIASLFVVATVPVALDPSFYQPVADAVSTGARSIWDWIRSLFTPKPTTVDKYVVLTSAQMEQVKRGPSNNKIYQIAYVNSSDMLQVSRVYLTWIESVALLNYVKPLNKMIDAVNGLRGKVSGVNVGNLGDQAKVDAEAMRNQSKIGIYTKEMLDAAKLAWAVGARENSSGEFKAETHNNKIGSKYFYHFHDGQHTIHIWYGSPI